MKCCCLSFTRSAYRKILGILSTFVLTSATLSAADSVNLEWDPSPSQGVTGYRVYYGFAGGDYSTTTNAGLATALTVQGLLEGQTYYFAVTALGEGDTESDFSNEVGYEVPLIPSNTPPTITLVFDQEVNEDEVLGPVAFTIDDAETAADNLVVTAQSTSSMLDGSMSSSTMMVKRPPQDPPRELTASNAACLA